MLKPFSQSFAAMGTDCLLHLYAADAEQADAVFEQVADEVLRIEARYSRYRPDSVLAAINRMAASGGRIEVDGETAALLDYAHACYRKSDGLFDISSGLLRQAWDFDSGRLPEPATIAALLPRMMTGGVVIIDDYGTWDGCTRAVHDYLSAHKRAEPIERFGMSRIPYLQIRET